MMMVGLFLLIGVNAAFVLLMLGSREKLNGYAPKRKEK